MTPDAAPVTVEEARETIQDALMDSQYLAGAKAAWNAAQSDDPEAAYAALVKSREGHMLGYKDAKARLAATPSDRARGEGGHADTEGEAVETWKHLNCPSCGGSGHIDDVNQPAEQRALAAEKERDEARAEVERLQQDDDEDVTYWHGKAEAAEAALAVSEQRVRALVEGQSDMFWDADDPEKPWDSPSEWAEELGQIESKPFVNRFQHAIRQPDIWVLFTPPTEEDGEWGTREFDTEVEAKAALLPAADGGSGEQG